MEDESIKWSRKFEVGRKLITDSGRKVLFALSKSEPTNRYQIHKKTHEENNAVSKSRVHDCMEKFEGLELVEGREVGTTRAGHPKKEYRLTPKGLIALWQYPLKSFLKDSKVIKLSIEGSTIHFPGGGKRIELLRTASKNHNVLREKIFSRWNLFEERGVEDAALGSLCRTFSESPRPFITISQGGKAHRVKFDEKNEVEETKEVELEEGTFVKASRTTSEQVKENIVISFYLYPLTWLSPLEERGKWIEIMVENEEIKDIVKKFCERRREELTLFIQSLKDLETAIGNEKELEFDVTPSKYLEREIENVLSPAGVKVY